MLAAQAVRAFAYGLGAVLLGATLDERGFTGTDAGLVLAAVLAGTVLASLGVARSGDAYRPPALLRGLYGALVSTGVVFAFSASVWPLVAVALLGGLSTEVVESGPFTSLEQAMLAGELERRRLARGFGAYNAVATAAGSLGALARPASPLPAGLVGGPERPRFFLLFVPAALAGMAIAHRLARPSNACPARRRQT